MWEWISMTYLSHLDSFLFLLGSHCMVCHHYAYESEIWCLDHYWQSMLPILPNLTMNLHLKVSWRCKNSLISHFCSLASSPWQLSVSVELPEHGVPPLCARKRDLVPWPQLVEHPPHAPQSDHEPSTENIIERQEFIYQSFLQTW